MDKWHKLTVVVKQTGIPYQSLARYVKQHAVHLQLKKEHKAYLLHQDSIPTIEQIRKHYERGLTTRQVEKELAIGGIPVVLEMEEENGDELATLRNVLLEINVALGSVNEKLEKQGDFNEELLKRLLDTQQAYIAQLEQKVASEPPKKKVWRFWK